MRLLGRSRSGVGVGVGVNIFRPESDSESLKIRRLRSPALKYVFLQWTGKTSIRVTNYNRLHDFGHNPFKKYLVPTSLLLSFIKSTSGRPIAQDFDHIPVLRGFCKQEGGFLKNLVGSGFGSRQNVMVAPGKIYWL